MVGPQGESKKHLWRALFLLCLGSGLLLLTKFGFSTFWDSLLCFGGGGLLLYANGEFLFGLLIHANAEDSTSPDASPLAPELAASQVQARQKEELE